MQAAVQMPPVYFCLTLLEAELFVLLSAEMGLALGLMLPNLHWTSEAAVIKTDRRPQSPEASSPRRQSRRR